MSSITMDLIRSRCIITIHIFTIKLFLIYSVKNAAQGMHWSLRVPQPLAGGSSLSTGAAIARRPLNRWQRVCAVDCQLVYQDLDSGVTTSAALSKLPVQMCTNAGQRLDCYRHTVACMGVHRIVFHGIMMRKR